MARGLQPLKEATNTSDIAVMENFMAKELIFGLMEISMLESLKKAKDMAREQLLLPLVINMLAIL